VFDPSSGGPERARYDVLDGMRGVAALCVMVHHFAPGSIQDNAAISVDLFFVLSGFVIAHSYGERLQSGMTFLEYMGRRLIRLYPMFLIGVLIGTPVLYFIVKAGLADYSKRDIAGSLLYNGLFLPYLATKGAHDLGADTVTFGEIFPTNPPAWSLFFELVASLAFVTLFRMTRNSLIKIIVFSYTALLLSAVLSSFIEYRQNLDIGQGWGTSNFLSGFPRVLFGFSFGVLLYSWLRTEYYSEVAAFVRQYVGSPYLLYGILVVIVAFPKIQGIFGDLYPVLILVSVVPCLVFIGSAVRCKGGFDFRVSKFLGWISYPVYCLHFPIGRAVFLWAGTDRWSQWEAVFVSIVGTLLAVVVLTRFYEEPARKYLTRKLLAYVKSERPVHWSQGELKH
jgi:peptidoglycan/LPS O-acetylase OafA/YrhL